MRGGHVNVLIKGVAVLLGLRVQAIRKGMGVCLLLVVKRMVATFPIISHSRHLHLTVCKVAHTLEGF